MLGILRTVSQFLQQESAKVLRNIYHRWGYDLFKLIWLSLKDIDSLDILRMLSYYLGTMGVASGISPLGQGGYYSLSLRGHGVFYLILGIEQSHNFSFKSQVSILTEQMELQRHNRGHYGFQFPVDMVELQQTDYLRYDDFSVFSAGSALSQQHKTKVCMIAM